MTTELPPISKPARARSAFTLIELLVVIAIMAILAGLVAMFAQRASEQKKTDRVRAELNKWTTLIDAYHAKLGVYPPSNPSYLPTNSLYYELSGTLCDGPSFAILNAPADVVSRTAVNVMFGLGGLINSATNTEPELAMRIGPIPQGDLIVITDASGNNPVKVPRVPVDGPGLDGKPTRTNLWFYNPVNPVHNPNSYDFWAVYFISGELRTNGNWKR